MHSLKYVDIQIPNGSGGWTPVGRKLYRYYAHNGDDIMPLAYVLHAEAYNLLLADSTIGTDFNAVNAPDATLKNYADYYFEYSRPISGPAFPVPMATMR